MLGHTINRACLSDNPTVTLGPSRLWSETTLKLVLVYNFWKAAYTLVGLGKVDIINYCLPLVIGASPTLISTTVLMCVCM